MTIAPRYGLLGTITLCLAISMTLAACAAAPQKQLYVGEQGRGCLL